MSESESLNFDLAPREVPVRVGGGGYVLREASGGAAIEYRNRILKGAERRDGAMVIPLTNSADVESLLVSRCLFHATLGDNDEIIEVGKAVPETTIKSWPSRIQKVLFKKVQEISELNEKPPVPGEEDPSKNGPSGTTGGSA